MGRLSNLLSLGDAARRGPPIRCRIAHRQEIEPSLRLILANRSGPADDQTVLDFLSLAVQRKMDLQAMWVAERGGRIVWALLPLVSPGKTMLLMSPGQLFRQTPPYAVGLLANAVCKHYSSENVTLAQFLLDPGDGLVRDLYRQVQFQDLAELIYLQRPVRGAGAPPQLPEGFELQTYSHQTSKLFIETIANSYERSLDCPALNGRRNLHDVIAGHQAVGAFDPSLWFVLSESGVGRGVLLLNLTHTLESVELVYLGLPPQSRGRGLGDLLMRLGLHAVGSRRLRDVSLAVDAQNTPALRLYYRHGMKQVGARHAMIRQLKHSDSNGE